MKAEKITILFGVERITLLYSLYPFWISKHRNRFVFTTDVDWVLNKDNNPYILLVRSLKYLPSKDQRQPFLEKLRKKYRKVFLFDDNDGTESFFLELLPLLDKCYKKQVFVDKENYAKDFEGKRLFSHYYYHLNNNTLPPPSQNIQNPPTKADLDKISLLWNVGIGSYPLSRYLEYVTKKGVKFFGSFFMNMLLYTPDFGAACPRPHLSKCHGRFGHEPYREEVGFQRKLLLQLIQNDSQFLAGKVDRKTYQKELKQVQAVLSPFGWGEICFRDFEAVLGGAVLVKPDVSHLETWPNIFIPGHTYIPICWDGSDLKEKTTMLLEDGKLVSKIRENAWLIYKQAFSELDEKVKGVIQDFER